jgi:small subunit ribosomal protein S4
MEFRKQFRGLFKKASATKGVTGEVTQGEARLITVFRMGIVLLEEVLDNLVSHRHVTVNGDVVIASTTLNLG